MFFLSSCMQSRSKSKAETEREISEKKCLYFSSYHHMGVFLHIFSISKKLIQYQISHSIKSGKLQNWNYHHSMIDLQCRHFISSIIFYLFKAKASLFRLQTMRLERNNLTLTEIINQIICLINEMISKGLKSWINEPLNM